MTGNRSPARPLAAPDDKHSPAAAERRRTTPNIIDYARSETRPFGVDAPFNAVDALVLASLVYQDMPACVRTLAAVEARSGTFRRRLSSIDVRHPVRSIRHLAAPEFGDATLASVSEALTPDDFHVESGHNGLADPRLTQELYAAIGVNPRFACVRVDASDEHFSEEQQMQFAAVTMLLPGGTLAVAFRGTDDSLVGWKEDFNMAFRYPVPAQHAACEYVCAVARLWRGPMVLLGHSKGGNLAVYAAMNASDEVKDRVERIYSLDGPGFPESVVNSFEYASVSDRIVKIVPDSSVVGMVLETPERCMVVKSDVEGIMQHFAFSWQMHGGEFDKVEDVANSSVTFNKALNGWLSNLSKEQRERAVDALFAVLEASGAGSISAMMAAGPKVIPEMLGTYVGLSVEDRRNLNQALGIMLQAALARNPKVRRR